MTEPNYKEESPIPAEPIDYAGPIERANPGYIPVKGRMAIGCLGYILLTVLWFVGFPYFASQWTINRLSPWAGVEGWAAMTIGLLGISLWLRVKFGYKGYGYGILSAFGLAALLLLGLYLLLLAICARR